MTQSESDLRPQARSDVESVVRGNTEFALDLYQELRTEEGNLFFSPHSISTALAMTYAGAHGETEAQMARALHFTLQQRELHAAFARLDATLTGIAQKGPVQLAVANALWPQEGYALLEEFLALVKRYYDVEITALDYGAPEAARRIINNWVEERTAHRIFEMIPPGILGAMTRLVLVNAIYFKGDWASQFDQELTEDVPFRISTEESVQVPMMHQTHDYRYRRVEGLELLELPYAGHDLSMLVLLPTEVEGLADLEERLTQENVAAWTERLWRTEVQVSLPRFKITFPCTLKAPLMSLGMVDAFGEAADFSRMDGTRLLYIAQVLHKAFVAVNEEGTEAAAAAAVTMKLRSMPSPPIVFRVDHPFVFLIRENSSGSVLFLGRVVDPR
jgi:serpin B